MCPDRGKLEPSEREMALAIARALTRPSLLGLILAAVQQELHGEQRHGESG